MIILSWQYKNNKQFHKFNIKNILFSVESRIQIFIGMIFHVPIECTAQFKLRRTGYNYYSLAKLENEKYSTNAINL